MAGADGDPLLSIVLTFFGGAVCYRTGACICG